MNTTNHQNAIVPPYGTIARALCDGNVIPFLGAGASMLSRPQGEPFDPRTSRGLPTGAELARVLAEDASYPGGEDLGDLAKVSSYFADISGRRPLRQLLRLCLDRPYDPGPLHRMLATTNACMTIVVTNYDRLVEQAFDEAGKPYDLVVYPADVKDFVGVLHWEHGRDEPRRVASNELVIDLKNTNVIFKMHGTICPANPKYDHFVITEEDYIEFLSRMTSNNAIPSLFSTHFRDKSFLFLGYSLRDWNLRVLLKNLGKSWGQRADDPDAPRSWAIQLDPSDLERRLWEKRGVTIFPGNLDSFVDELRRRITR